MTQRVSDRMSRIKKLTLFWPCSWLYSYTKLHRLHGSLQYSTSPNRFFFFGCIFRVHSTVQSLWLTDWLEKWICYCCCWVTHSCLTLCDPWTAACQTFLSFTISLRVLKFMSIESMTPFNNLILCCPLLLLSSVFSSIWIFSSELALRIRWLNYWFQLQHESFRVDWFDLLAVQGTLKNFLQHHSSKASILLLSAFFMVQFSHPNMTTGKTMAFDYLDLCWQSDVSAF